MGFSLSVNVPAITVFLQGLVSFFSPCVLPLIPLYIGYLSGGTGTRGADGKLYYKRGKVMLHTLFFVIGVSFAFFLLGFGFSAMGTFFRDNQLMFARIGGILIIFFGLNQLGIFGSSTSGGREFRLPFRLDRFAMSPLTALIMGFTFSFAWTPCVGPALASVLLMAASAGTKTAGMALIGVYTLGFVLPFLAVGLFTTTLLDLFKKHGGVVKYTVKAGGVLMIVMGLLMFTGKMNSLTGYLSRVPSSFGTQAVQESQQPGNEDGNGQDPQGGAPATGASDESGESAGETAEESAEESAGETAAESAKESAAENDLLPAIDFTLKDQFGNEHTLSDYKGKTVFLNFWATWCPPCRAEMPEIQKLYETYDQEGDDGVVILGIAAPEMGSETTEEGISDFLEKNGYTYPVVMDTTGEIFEAYGIYSFPTTFMIDRDGNVFGYASGQLSEDMMHGIIKQTQEGKRSR